MEQDKNYCAEFLHQKNMKVLPPLPPVVQTGLHSWDLL